MNGLNARKFHTFLRQAAADVRKRIENHRGPFPVSWNTVAYKEYPECPTITLPRDVACNPSLKETLVTRRSTQNFSNPHTDLKTLSSIFYYALGRCDLLHQHSKDGHRRHYPSGGALYPMETYVAIDANVVEDIPGGIYHYNVKSHSLEEIGNLTLIPQITSALNLMRPAPIMFMLGVCWERTMQKYQDLGYKLALLETGHAAQNILLVATAHGLATWPYAGHDEVKVNNVLNLPAHNEEDIIYCIGMGKPTDDTEQFQP